MKVVMNTRRAYSLFDALLGRLRANEFPYLKEYVVVPQTFIPEEIRKDKRTLSCFYFFVCIYMRGSIRSNTVFKQLISMWQNTPELFDPASIVNIPDDEIKAIISGYVGWDKENSPIFWKRNAELLMQQWKGDPLELLRGMRSYEEACRRIKNKRKDGAKKPLSLDSKGSGFWGFQEKMVSMFLYFCDWDGLLESRFIYPSAADFHHVRVFFGGGVMKIKKDNGTNIRYDDRYLSEIRRVLVSYLKARKEDPVDLGDALWLFSLILCGNSPATQTQKRRDQRREVNDSKSNDPLGLDDDGLFNRLVWLRDGKNVRERLLKTCGICPLNKTCESAIPAGPYYDNGKIIFLPHPVKWSEHPSSLLPKIPTNTVAVSHKHLELNFNTDE